jgi:hypothetical protein
VLVRDVEDDVDATRHDPRGKFADGVRGYLSLEDQLDIIWSAQVEVIGHQRLEEGTSAMKTRVRDVSILRIESSHQ